MVEVSFKCDGCGTLLEWPDDVFDSDVITCSKCGKISGTYGDLRRTAEQAVLNELNRRLGQKRNTASRSKSIRLFITAAPRQLRHELPHAVSSRLMRPPAAPERMLILPCYSTR